MQNLNIRNKKQNAQTVKLTDMRKLLFFLLVCPIVAFGQLPAPLKNTYVHDYARILSPGQTLALNRAIKAIDTANNVKFAIVLVNQLPDNYTIEDYAREIGNKWQVGKGVIYVAAITQRKQRLEVSAHLEGVIADATALHITDNIKPFFKAKDYYGGLMGMVAEIDALLKADAGLQKQPKVKAEEANDTTAMVIVLGGFGLAIATALYLLYTQSRRNKKLREQINKEPHSQTFAEIVTGNSILSSGHDFDYTPPLTFYNPPSSGGGSSDSDRSSSSDNNNYGNYDSGTSNDSYSGGGASNDW